MSRPEDITPAASATRRIDRNQIGAVSEGLLSVMNALTVLMDREVRLAVSVLDTTLNAVTILGDGETVSTLAKRGYTRGAIWPLATEYADNTVLAADTRVSMIHEEAVLSGCALSGYSTAVSPIISETEGLAGHIALIIDGTVPEKTLHSLVVLCSEMAASQVALFDRADGLRRVISEQHAIIDNISDGLLVIERSGRVRHMNGPAGRILGLDPTKSVGKRFSEMLDFEPRLQSVFDTADAYFDREQIIDTATRHLHLLDTVIPIKNTKGDVESVVNTFREIQRARRMAHNIAGSRARYTFGDIIGSSDAIRDCIDRARRAASGAANILLSGESGTGKELFAQSIHNASKRAGGPFVAINCAALPRDLIESELFGYVAGSFTGAHRDGRPGKFELASSGTMFLDEVTEMPLDVQAKLLRVLQEREVTRIGDTRAIPVDVRIIAASNRDLPAMVAKRGFREDLYYRLNVIQVAIPSLRERGGDVEELAKHFVGRYTLSLGKTGYALGPAALQKLYQHPWPGNVRELENSIERVVNLSADAALLDIELPSATKAAPLRPASSAARSLREAERDTIRAAFEHTGDNVTRAASILGVSRATLYSKVREYGIVLGRPSKRGG